MQLYKGGSSYYFNRASLWALDMFTIEKITVAWNFKIQTLSSMEYGLMVASMGTAILTMGMDSQ